MEESDTERGTTVRIFVGGLGESVKEDELRNIFRSFGSIQGSVDIIRTKGRSFAYCDFIPSSPNSLTKLFGIYNGCVWKGGRLKLEKAKEHFLVRLRQEWEEDSSLSNAPEDAVDADTMKESAEEEPKKGLIPSGQLKIFCPRLRKVKSLPLKGTGKHKYSFQRFNALPIPKHFCDCEEHSGPPEQFKEQQTSKLDSLNGGMDTEEIDLMKSVMNKLFEKETMHSKVVENVNNKVMEKDVSVAESDELPDANIEEDLSEDSDDLVTNIVTTSRNATVGVRKKVSRSHITETSKDGKKRPKVEKSSSPHETNSRAILDDGGNGDDLQINTMAVIGTQPQEAVQTKSRSIWSQKSSWKELIGNVKNSSFSVSNILTDSALKEEQLELGNAGADDSSDSESDSLVEEGTASDSSDSESRSFVEEETVEDGSNEPSKSHGLVEEESVEDASTEPSKSHDLVEEATVEIPTREPSEIEDTAGVSVTKASNTSNSGRGSAWLHKSSWTELLKANSTVSFSLSGICSSQKEVPKEDTVFTNLGSMQKNEQPSNAVVKETKEDNTVKMAPHLQPKTVTDGGSGAKTRTETVDGEGEVCRFMRSSASMKDWFKSKTALTGSRKRKKNTEASNV